ncbi:phage tail protein (plasmid) [Serratia marcescens]|uniref:phage tail protein n=1 Tax=Serratia TaxID=613 RepID=UPI002570886A|nr:MULTISPECIES: phage tail protein [Serratia]MDM1819176.1 phage tail protein [Serratia ureilytica]WJD90520.1 phage tail protein [Serratia marcescens]
MKTPWMSAPNLSHRFLATFFIKGIPSPMDVRFARVSGLGRELQITQLRQGGDNLGTVNLAEHVTHGTLVFERGLATLTPVTAMFELVLGQFANISLNAVILLLDSHSRPLCSWTITDALPVKWSTGDLDAAGNTVLIETLELAYHELHWEGR